MGILLKNDQVLISSAKTDIKYSTRDNLTISNFLQLCRDGRSTDAVIVPGIIHFQ